MLIEETPDGHSTKMLVTADPVLADAISRRFPKEDFEYERGGLYIRFRVGDIHRQRFEDQVFAYKEGWEACGRHARKEGLNHAEA